MSGVYRSRRRWRRWVAFGIAVAGLTLLVMLAGIWVAILAADGQTPGSPPPPARTLAEVFLG